MELFVRNVPFSISDEDLRVHLARKIHQPPIQDPGSPPLNFGVELFRKGRSNVHRGMGIVTFPDASSASVFLQLHHVISIAGKPVSFTRSNRPTNEARVAAVMSRPWVDPESVRRERKRHQDIASASSSITIELGRICRKSVFAAELTVQGRVICDPDLRRLVINIDPVPINRRMDLESIFSAVMSHVPSKSFWYRAHNINTILSSDDGCHIYIQSSLPATIQVVGDLVTDRLSSLRTDGRLTPLIFQGLCLHFATSVDAHQFLHRCKEIHLPTPINRSMTRILREEGYSEKSLDALQVEIRSLSFPLAFEVEKAYWAGLLEASELLSLCGALHELEARHDNLTAASAFRQFTSVLNVPSLRDTLHTPLAVNVPPQTPTSTSQTSNSTSPQSGSKSSRKRRNRRTRKRQLASTAPHRAEQDLTGLLHEAVEAYLVEARTPKRRFAPSPAIYQSYHLIVTPTTQVLEGPLPDQSNSVLRRYNNNEAFLRVSFQDEDKGKPRREQSFSIDQLLEKRYRPVLTGGVLVAGRKFDFLGYSMSGLKDYSFAFVTPFTFQGNHVTADIIRGELGDFTRAAYRPALLGARWGQMFSTSLPSVEISPDMIKRIPDRTAGTSTNALFTDGCSTISHELITIVKEKVLRRAKFGPSALQFRLGGAKGVLFMDPALTGQMLTIRPSQTKFDSENIRSLDVTTTSAKPIYCYLNRPMIALLEHHKVPNESFKRLQDWAISEVRQIKKSLDAAATTFTHHGLGASFHLESLFRNMARILQVELSQDLHSESGIRFDLLKTVIAYGATHILREIKHRARIRVPGSYTLIGVSDEWDCLEEGEVYATIFDPRTNERVAVEGRVLITRSPQIHPGDVQFATAVRRPELNHLTNVVVFSCRGSRSLPSCLGGGDLDGDIYNIILDQALFPPKAFTAEPGAYKPLPPDTRSYICGKAEVADFVINYIKSDLLGYISTLHLRISDLKGVDCDECLLLAKKASHAVDFPKVGTPVNFKELPLPPDRNLRPDYLSGEGVNPGDAPGYYLSKKILGILYRSVPVDEYRPRKDEADLVDHELLDNLIEPHMYVAYDLSLDPDENVLEEMRHILDEYCQQLLAIAKVHTVSKGSKAHLSEAELVCGCIMEHYYDHKKRRETTASMNLQTHELTRAIRQEFFPPPEESDDEEFDDNDYDDNFSDLVSNDELERDIQHLCVKFNRARAGWVAAQEALTDAREERVRSFGPQSFGIIALGVMLDVLKELKKPRTRYQ
ncbi:RdRP-domain-containing protein [Guyanagaster necrorhizus]|uniref:RNA-dependent RNA polymerase n=1 Tax=Guyanagaster necrorhizus TaxID=856835 RepID=A0A9P8AQP4_9AGAR|nr:RdRP-domain-containing protein [Guyanagaster necrorhizus MCA 3950]KAG7444334.1 RdRP-domain-containing protein [Guyanagaster necrorhizus MCA 3950]